MPGAGSSPREGIITDKDVQELMTLQDISSIDEGDCVFLHTGHGDLWDSTNWHNLNEAEKSDRSRRFLSGEPGFGLSACKYLASRKIMLTGSDTWATEAFRPDGKGEEGDFLECHIELQTRHGIWNLENLDFTPLLADGVYEFLFVWSPLKIRGGTGSPGNPMALY